MPGLPLQPCFIIHRRDYRNDSLLLELFTLHEGRLPAIARGAKSGRAQRAILLQPFTPLQVSLSGRGEIKTLGQVEQEGKGFALIGKLLYCGFYLNELLMRLLQRNDPHERLFAYYMDALTSLAEGEEMDVCLRAFEVRLLQELGYELLLDRNSETHEPVLPDRKYEYVIEQGPIDSTQLDPRRLQIQGQTLLNLHAGLPMDRTQLVEAKNLMRRILTFYLGEKPLKSRELFRGFVDVGK